MTLTLHAHPFAAFCQKALVALHENATPFALRHIDLGKEEDRAALIALWPFRKFPVLVDDDRVVAEATLIIDHLDRHHPGATRFTPEDADAAAEVRLIDRVIDNYVLAPMQKIATDPLRAEGERDPVGVEQARATMQTAYAWLDKRLAGRRWLAGEDFTLADCGAAPGLLYGDWSEPIPETCPALREYRARLLTRPSVVTVVEAARPYRHLFPLGDPGRD
jgi:glutathione S-transferase